MGGTRLQTRTVPDAQVGAMKLPASVGLLEHRARKTSWLLKGALVALYLRLHGCEVGRGLKCKMFPTFRQIPDGNIILGKNVTLGYRVMLDIGRRAKLFIADHANLTQDLVISCGSEVTIGAYSGIGEFCSVRDGEHGIRAGRHIHDQPIEYTPIRIGSDVQVSRGCTVLGGAILEDGSVLGAESVAGRNFRAVANGIYFGAPPKLIGKRSSSETDLETNNVAEMKFPGSIQ